jgi:hypothetical protein
MKKRIFLSLLLAIISLNSWAENLAHSLAATDPNYDSSWYLGADIGAMSYEQANLNAFRMGDRRLVLGKNLNRIFALEMQLGNSSSDTEVVSGVPVTLTVDNYVAGFLKANLTFTSKDWKYNRFRLYGMLGGTRLKTTSDDTVVSTSGIQTSVSAGVGMEFLIDNIGIRLGYTRYVNRSSNSIKYSLDSLYLGVVYQFGQDTIVNAH